MSAPRFALVALASCAAEPLWFDIDTAYSSAERDDIMAAVATWNGIATRPISIGGGPRRIEPSDPGPGFAGRYRDDGLIQIRSGLGTLTYWVALHELGHAEGLKHVERGVMDPAISSLEFTDDDFRECHRVEACR